MCELTIIDKTIDIWKKKATAKTYQETAMGEYDYPLCDKYVGEPGTHPCYGCPVLEGTGLPWCEGTPLGMVKVFRKHWSRKPNSWIRGVLYRFQARRYVETLVTVKKSGGRRANVRGRL